MSIQVQEQLRTYAVEGGPASARVELARRIEQRLTARDARVDAALVVVPVLARECALRALLTTSTRVSVRLHYCCAYHT